MKLCKALILPVFLVSGLGMSVIGQAADGADSFNQGELDQMLAPVALYPDTVLSHLLIAATYPLEVVQAARWTRNNPQLHGETAVDAVEHMPWDPSVKALTAFPELLQRMDEDLDWTRRLGDAFLLQEEQVMDTVQYLRAEAQENGHLRSNKHVKVVREIEYIYIEPAVTDVVYVPYYDPRRVFVHWRWPAYPPHYWHHPHGHRAGFHFYWGHGYHIAPVWFYFSALHWPRHEVVVHHHHHRRHKAPRHKFHSGREVARHKEARHWRHDRQRRGNVRYRRGVDERRFMRHWAEPGKTRSAPGRAFQSRREHERNKSRRIIRHEEPYRPGRQARPVSSARSPADRPQRQSSPRRWQSERKVKGLREKHRASPDRGRFAGTVSKPVKRKVEQLRRSKPVKRVTAPVRGHKQAERSFRGRREAAPKRSMRNQRSFRSPRAARSQRSSSPRRTKSFRNSDRGKGWGKRRD